MKTFFLNIVKLDFSSMFIVTHIANIGVQRSSASKQNCVGNRNTDINVIKKNQVILSN